MWTYDREVGRTLADYARAFIGRLDPEVQERFAYQNGQRLIERVEHARRGTPLAVTSTPVRPAPPMVDAFPEVWSSDGFDGPTFEFKTNCSDAYDKLEACPLFQMSRVVVISPARKEYELAKDFNINSYSGEVTRRWVLYGPPGAGLPAPGEYRFDYYEGDETVLQQVVSYQPEVSGFPTGVQWRRDGSALQSVGRLHQACERVCGTRYWYTPMRGSS